MLPADLATTISAPRLDLVLLTRDWLESYGAGEPVPDLGFDDQDDVLRGHEGLVQLRAAQIAADPEQEPWLLRMMVLRAEGRGRAVGYVTFHGAPDDRGRVEVGYRVEAQHRGRGYATEAVAAMGDWAARHGARLLRASISPDNAASIALVRRAGFEVVGEQVDDVDRPEIIWERRAMPPDPAPGPPAALAPDPPPDSPPDPAHLSAG